MAWNPGSETQSTSAPVFNLFRDPREERPHVGLALWSGASFQDMAKRHMMPIAKHPHAKLGKGKPYGGIANLRPESKETVENFASWHPKKQGKVAPNVSKDRFMVSIH